MAATYRMERVRSLMATTATLAALALTTGCHWSKFSQTDSQSRKLPEGVATNDMATFMGAANPVVQAAAVATSPLDIWNKGARVPVVEMTTLWRNKIDYLPDPSPGKNGQMGPGLAGQLFLFGPNMQFAQPDGKLTVALYDETPRPPGQAPLPPEGWEFDKETLKQLRTFDERFGMSYALFLPWPTYRPDVTRIRIAVRYDPEKGHPIYGSETRITLDNSANNGKVAWSNQVVTPGSQAGNEVRPTGFTGSPASPAAPITPPSSPLTSAPPGFGAIAPVPPTAFGGPISPAAPAGPAGLPPIATVIPPLGR
jgi:hypothetical protein